MEWETLRGWYGNQNTQTLSARERVREWGARLCAKNSCMNNSCPLLSAYSSSAVLWLAHSWQVYSHRCRLYAPLHGLLISPANYSRRSLADAVAVNAQRRKHRFLLSTIVWRLQWELVCILNRPQVPLSAAYFFLKGQFAYSINPNQLHWSCETGHILCLFTMSRYVLHLVFLHILQ